MIWYVVIYGLRTGVATIGMAISAAVIRVTVWEARYARGALAGTNANRMAVSVTRLKLRLATKVDRRLVPYSQM